MTGNFDIPSGELVRPCGDEVLKTFQLGVIKLALRPWREVKQTTHLAVFS